MKRDVQFVRTIDAPYGRVRDRLRDHPASLFGDGGGPDVVTTMTARVRGTDVTRRVRIGIGGFDEPEAAAAGAHLAFSADADRHAGRFPHLEARLDAIPVDDRRTALFLIATYKPPLGLLGGIVDAFGIHQFAEGSLSDLFDRIAGVLEA